MKFRRQLFAVMIGLLGFLTGAFAETLVIKGSNTFGEELGPNLIAAFRALHPNIEVEIESKGTATGFDALLAGKCDIAAASRPASEEEQRLSRSRGITMGYHVIGYYGAAIVVNPSNRVLALTDTQVRAIFTGATRNWKEIGGTDGEIRVYVRDPSSGTYLGFQEIAMGGRPYAPTAKRLTSYAEIAEAVNADQYGIGYTGMNLMRAHASVIPVRINGELPTAKAVNEGVYPYARQLRLYTNRNDESAACKNFIRFVKSSPGQEVLNALGFVRWLEPPTWPPRTAS